MDGEQILQGGVANAGAVVRSGDHVLRPSNPHSASIHTLLRGVRASGFHGASEPVSIDPDGRERLRFVPGDVPLAPYPSWAQTDEVLASVAVLIRGLHDASIGLSLAGESWSSEMADPHGGPVMCHNDVCLENVVFRDGSAVALLDFDFAAPGRREFDLAAFARMCVPIDDDSNASRLGWASIDKPMRLRVVCDAYGCDESGRADVLRVCPIRSPVEASSSDDESRPARSPSSRCGTTWAAKSASTADVNGGRTNYQDFADAIR